MSLAIERNPPFSFISVTDIVSLRAGFQMGRVNAGRCIAFVPHYETVSRAIAMLGLKCGAVGQVDLSAHSNHTVALPMPVCRPEPTVVRPRKPDLVAVALKEILRYFRFSHFDQSLDRFG